MTNKQPVIETVQSLRETLTTDQIINEIAQFFALRKGEEAAEDLRFADAKTILPLG